MNPLGFYIFFLGMLVYNAVNAFGTDPGGRHLYATLILSTLFFVDVIIQSFKEKENETRKES